MSGGGVGRKLDFTPPGCRCEALGPSGGLRGSWGYGASCSTSGQAGGGLLRGGARPGAGQDWIWVCGGRRSPVQLSPTWPGSLSSRHWLGVPQVEVPGLELWPHFTGEEIEPRGRACLQGGEGAWLLGEQGRAVPRLPPSCLTLGRLGVGPSLCLHGPQHPVLPGQHCSLALVRAGVSR